MQTMNQLTQTAVKGQVDLHHGGNAISVVSDISQVADMVPGQAVSLVDGTSKIMSVAAVANSTTKCHGVILRNLQKSSFSTHDSFEIGINGAVVFMEASAAIARGAKVAYVATGEKVAAAIATNVVLGIALDKAAADGDLIRVMIAPMAVTETL